MNYWLDLVNGTTWKEFRDAGANVSGFRARRKATADRIQPGDILLCYMTGVMRWVGALEVVGPSDGAHRIWADEDFSVRLAVRPLVLLNAEHGVPMKELEGRVDFYRDESDWGMFKAFVRQSPNRFQKQEDGTLIFGLLQQANLAPVSRPVDAKKLAHQPFYRTQRPKGDNNIETVVSVPESEEPTAILSPSAVTIPAADTEFTTRHTEIQFELLRLGAEMGLDVWVARNDRTKVWKTTALGTMPRMVSELPTQFNEVTNKTIEHIDVLWLRGNSILAAFEIECTTSVYSGLLRMSDLLALQPNIDIRLYLVAPDERRAKVEQEILRPTFAMRDRPLPRICGFLPFSTLMKKVNAAIDHGFAASLKPDFLEKTAEYFTGTSKS